MARKAPKTRKVAPEPAHKPRSEGKRAGANAVIADRFRLEGTYQRLRRALQSAPQDGRLERTLSYWVLPTDRSLPLALLDRTLSELLSEELEALMETPGVGHKKILGLFELLRRAIRASDPHEPFGLPNRTRSVSPKGEKQTGADNVSEAVWRMWADTVERVGLADHRLGRVAPCLRPLPTVIWNKRLGDYTELALEEIRELKTHGEKRVRAVLDVFAAVHEAVSTSVLDERLQIDLQPRFVPAVNRWLTDASATTEALGVGELRTQVVKPLLQQVDHDLGSHVAELAEWRLTAGPDAPTVKQQAARLQVTRARIYQLLEDCARMASVRWPEGRWMLAPLDSGTRDLSRQFRDLVTRTTALFFPQLEGV